MASKEIKPTKALEQVEPKKKGDMVEADRLSISVCVGKKGETTSGQSLR
jgi:hypothetical protein